MKRFKILRLVLLHCTELLVVLQVNEEGSCYSIHSSLCIGFAHWPDKNISGKSCEPYLVRVGGAV